MQSWQVKMELGPNHVEWGIFTLFSFTFAGKFYSNTVYGRNPANQIWDVYSHRITEEKNLQLMKKTNDKLLLMVQKSQGQPPEMVLKPCN